jgi:regulator of sigma E protease
MLMHVFESIRTPAAFLFVLGVLVFVHELGHFLVARWHGVRVITFSLGFGPKLIKFTRGATEYCISAVPLGGYVKLAGETAEEERTGAPDEFLSMSKWVRFQVYLAGPVMNLLLAVVLLAGILMQGADVPLFETAPAVIGAIAPGSAAAQAGLRVGDRIVRVGGRDVPTWDALNVEIVPKANQELSIEVDRQGQRVPLRVTPAGAGTFEIGDLGVRPILRPQFVRITPGDPADRAGLRRGDVVLAVNSERDLEQPAIIKLLQASVNVPLTFTIERDGVTSDVSVLPVLRAGVGAIGVVLSPWEVRRIDPTLLQACAMSVTENWENARFIGRTLRGLVTRDTKVNQLMGPLAIGQMAGMAAQLGWLQLFQLMVMLSLNLGILNLMPVPVLDGGHIAILAVEGLARRDLSLKVKERILIGGAALIVVLMVTVIFNDVMRIFR